MWAFGAALALAAGLTAHAEAPQALPRAVVELFTSQGCSACPPADAMLGRLAARKDIVALTLPVDYWDYLGWKDTLADPAHSERQRSYAKVRGDNQVYTPQMVINGLAHVVGKRLDRIEAAIAETEKALDGRRIPVRLTSKGDSLTIQVEGAAEESSGVVWVLLIRRAATVTIERGENGGKTITYHNVVRHMMPVGTWSGQPMTLKLPISHLLRGDADGCVVLLQQGVGGPILGAAMFPAP